MVVADGRKHPRSRPRTTPKRAPAAQALAVPTRQQLHALFMALRDVDHLAVVCTDALRFDNGYTGRAVAYLLRRLVSDRLAGEIERLGALLKVDLKRIQENE